MVRQLLRRGQVTLPASLLKELGLREKDYVQVVKTPEGILIQPVTVSDYSPAELEALRKKLDELPRGAKKIHGSFSQAKKHLDSLKGK